MIHRALLFLALPLALTAAPVPVKITPDGFIRGGQPYFVKGAGGEEQLPRLAALGANSIRTWGTEDLGKKLDAAAASNLSVSAGIWLESECNWFSYHNPGHCAKQAERVKKDVLAHRDHPALLAWGLGNEAEGGGDNVDFWKQLNRLALLVRELDPAHPSFTAVAGVNAAKINNLNEHAPALDYLGVNTYGALPSLRKTLHDLNWARPWLVTEWGTPGFWERPRGAGDMPLEPTGTEKATAMAFAYDAALKPDHGCLGSYAFIWGWKNEGSVTWFGLLTDRGESTPAVGVLQQRWTGKAPGNSAPSLTPLAGVPQKPVAPGTAFTVATTGSDPDGDPLEYRWAVLPQQTGHDNGVSPPMPAPMPDCLPPTPPGPKMDLRAPAKPGKYRVYLWLADNKNNASTANVPLVVE
ncbi:MAG: hypothetical protein JWL81_2677 [Verrucomicrobiales bacterium]|nr:hypothetical protein [Verrucomicrobiales bacterium]